MVKKNSCISSRSGDHNFLLTCIITSRKNCPTPSQKCDGPSLRFTYWGKCYYVKFKRLNSFTGPPGPTDTVTGPQGDPGPQGEKGDRGVPGQAGSAGDRGEKGKSNHNVIIVVYHQYGGHNAICNPEKIHKQGLKLK